MARPEELITIVDCLKLGRNLVPSLELKNWMRVSLRALVGFVRHWLASVCATRRRSFHRTGGHSWVSSAHTICQLLIFNWWSYPLQSPSLFSVEETSAAAVMLLLLGLPNGA